MSKIKYSEDQKKAIYSKKKNIIVSAQAGAGKTQVLVERILLLLRGLEEKSADLALGEDLVLTGSKTDIDRMLIVTFTNKAAQEMKDRIKSNISDLMDDKVEDLAYLSQQFNKVTNAQISTMHSFCINTVRAYFHKLGLNPKFKVLNSASLEVLKWEAMDQVFQDFYAEGDQDFFQFLFEYATLKDDEDIKADLLSLYEFLMSQLNPFEWLDEAISYYSELEPDKYTQDDKDLKLRQVNLMLDNQVEEILIEAMGDLRLMEQYAKSSMVPGEFAEMVEADKRLLEELDILRKGEKFEGLLDLATNPGYKGKPRGFNKESSDYSLDEINLLMKKRDDGFKKKIGAIKDALTFDLDQIIDIEYRIYKFLNVIKRLLLAYDKTFKAKKRDKEGIDFSDAEHMMIDLLQDTEVVTKLRDKFAYIFFDEYQDANQIQNYIVDTIRREDNLFFVGDIKQSIYRFRLADPTIFNARYEEYKFGENSTNLAVDLSENYRTRKPILDFANLIFNELMTKRLGEVDYDDPAQRLLAAGKFDEIPDLVSVEINYISGDVTSEELDQAQNPDLIQLFKESNQPYLIAKKIRNMIDEGAKAKDFGILLRSKLLIPEICDYLQAFDIPFFTDSYNFDYSNLEVAEFINIIKAIDNDKDDLVLLSVLLSVLGGFTEDDLAIIRAGNKSVSFYRSFYDYEGDEEICKKIADYKEKIQHFKKLEETMSLYDFAWQVLIDSGYMTYLLSMANGKAKLDNVLTFIEDIRDFEVNSKLGLYNLLNYVDRLSKRKLGAIEPGADLSDQDDVVRIMTIHKSKGLQMKNVILADMQKDFNMRDLNKNIMSHNKLGLALRNYDFYQDKLTSNIFTDRLARTIKLESLSEESRLLYVAMTRAINRLIIFGSIKEDYFDKLHDVHENSKSSLDWISSIILKDQITDSFKREHGIKIETSTRILTPELLNLRMNLYNKEDLIKEKLAYLSETQVKDRKLEIKDYKVFDYFDFVYPHKDGLDAVYKKTVSQLASHNDNKSSEFKAYPPLEDFEERRDMTIIDDDFEIEELGYEKPAFLQFDRELTPAERGTINHFVLQLLPVKHYDMESLQDELARLILQGSLREEEKELVDLQSIIVFYQSDLGQRAIKSGNARKEEAFTMKYDDLGNQILVDGQIDMFFEEEDGLVIIDFKTGNFMKPEKYQRQFELYTLGLEGATGKKVKEKYIYWTSFYEFSRM